MNGNILFAISAGLGAALLGALIWMGITVATGLHIGYVALGVGVIVGFAVRWAGHGSTPIFGVVGALCTLLGCVGGEALAMVQLTASHNGVGFFDLLSQIDAGKLIQGVFSGASPITYFIYAIGIYEGYKLSILTTPRSGVTRVQRPAPNAPPSDRF